MFKTLTSAAFVLVTAGLANGDPLPPPPEAAYTPPATSDCNSETLYVYFPAGTSALTPASRAILKEAQARLEGCVLGQVSLNASAADARSEAEARSLSAARIETVTAALSAHELDGMHIADVEPSADPGASLWAPMDRKVEIRLAAWAPEIS